MNRCVLRGCVPKKLLVYGANFPHDFESSRGFGWSFETEPKHDWKTLITNKNAELNRLTGVYKSLLQKSGVDLIEGRGKVLSEFPSVLNSLDFMNNDGFECCFLEVVVLVAYHLTKFSRDSGTDC